jgi:hypothetical protein
MMGERQRYGNRIEVETKVAGGSAIGRGFVVARGRAETEMVWGGVGGFEREER